MTTIDVLLEACVNDRGACLVAADWYEGAGDNEAAACMRWAAERSLYPAINKMGRGIDGWYLEKTPKSHPWAAPHAIPDVLTNQCSSLELFCTMPSVAAAWLELIRVWRRSPYAMHRLQVVPG